MPTPQHSDREKQSNEIGEQVAAESMGLALKAKIQKIRSSIKLPKGELASILSESRAK